MTRRGARGYIGRVADCEVAARMTGDRTEEILARDIAAGGAAVGEIWTAKVVRALGPGAARLRADGRDFFLNAAATPGELKRVRVTRPGGLEAHKDPAVSEKIELRGRYLVCTPGAPGVNASQKIADPQRRAALINAVGAAAGDGVGFVVRTCAARAEPADVSAEATALAQEAAALLSAPLSPPRRLRAAPGLKSAAAELWDIALEPAPSGRLEAAVAEALRAEAPLGPAGDGAWLSCARAPGASIFDVNAGRAGSAEAVNLAAAAEVPRQLRLRGWGGAILIDFIDGGGDAAARARLEAALRERLDSATRLLGWGPAGFCEMTRRVDRPPLESLFPNGVQP